MADIQVPPTTISHPCPAVAVELQHHVRVINADTDVKSGVAGADRSWQQRVQA